MSISVNRSQAHSQPMTPYQEGESKPATKEAGSSSFLQLVIENNPDISRPNRPISLSEHRNARRQVFEKLVTSTLSQPGHPFAELTGPLKQDMISAITDELVQSHFQV